MTLFSVLPELSPNLPMLCSGPNPLSPFRLNSKPNLVFEANHAPFPAVTGHYLGNLKMHGVCPSILMCFLDFMSKPARRPPLPKPFEL